MAPTDAETKNELPPDLRAMYEVERALPGTLTAEGRARILDVVARTVPAVSAAAGYSLATVIVASIVSAAVGAGVTVGVMSRLPSEATPPGATVADGGPTRPDGAAPPRLVHRDASVTIPAPVVPQRATPPARHAANPSEARRLDRPEPPVRGERTTDERNLVDRARAAIARGNPHEALIALMEHERTFPRGALHEEREYLVITALVAQRKLDIAAARASAYRLDFPRGAYLYAIDRLLGPHGTTDSRDQ